MKQNDGLRDNEIPDNRVPWQEGRGTRSRGTGRGAAASYVIFPKLGAG